MILDLKAMHDIMGAPVVVTEAAVKLVVRRVRGGYMNRWLIREAQLEPTIFIRRVGLGIVIYAHPELAELLRRD